MSQRPMIAGGRDWAFAGAVRNVTANAPIETRGMFKRGMVTSWDGV